MKKFRFIFTVFENAESEGSIDLIIECERPVFTYRDFKMLKSEMYEQLIQYVDDNEYPVSLMKRKPYRRVKNCMVQCEAYEVSKDPEIMDRFMFLLVLERDEFFDSLGYFNIDSKWSKCVGMEKFI